MGLPGSILNVRIRSVLSIGGVDCCDPVCRHRFRSQRKGTRCLTGWAQTGTKVRCEPRLFSQGKTPEFTKMSEIHELCVLALSSIWFARATPDACGGWHIFSKNEVRKLGVFQVVSNVSFHQMALAETRCEMGA